ncbi:MAG: phosphoglycerate kinase [Syntrophobacteraceae bacterium]|jgi:phosphoglycerate kinase|nr:phosphoglycerate kinase [Syntrophobacteraceae bacterium]
MIRRLDTLDLGGKRVFVRVDFNVPLDRERKVKDDLRIRAVLPTIRRIVDLGGKVILASHLGRPKGKVAPEFSLKPVAEYLSTLLECPVPLAPDCVGEAVREMVGRMKPGDVLMLENLRFHPGEERNDEDFSRQLAELADVYVNDAFAVSHRAHASVHGITRLVPVCAAGVQLEKEIDYFHKSMEEPRRPVAMVIGGAKVSTKIELLQNLLDKADHILIGGAMACTFLKAQGRAVGRSMVEDDFLQTARELLDMAAQKGVQVVLPVDAVVAPELDAVDEVRLVSVDAIPEEGRMLDVGSGTLEAFEAVLRGCRTVVWNGPLGVFERPPFHQGTFRLAEFLGELDALTVIGGGDSAAAVRQAGADRKVGYVSTGGGAFLEMLEGKKLPGIEALEACG